MRSWRPGGRAVWRLAALSTCAAFRLQDNLPPNIWQHAASLARILLHFVCLDRSFSSDFPASLPLGCRWFERSTSRRFPLERPRLAACHAAVCVLMMHLDTNDSTHDAVYRRDRDDAELIAYCIDDRVLPPHPRRWIKSKGARNRCPPGWLSLYSRPAFSRWVVDVLGLLLVVSLQDVRLTHGGRRTSFRRPIKASSPR